MPLGNKQGGRKMRLKGFFALALTAALSCTALAYKPALAEDTGLDQVGRGDYLGGVKGKKVIFIPIAMGFDITEFLGGDLAQAGGRARLYLRDPRSELEHGCRHQGADRRDCRKARSPDHP